jgi:hypothetical protein
MTDAATAAAKWARNMQSAGPTIQAGVMNTQKDPTALAVAQLPLAQANYTAAIQSGKTAAGLQRSGKAGWQQGMLKKGLANLANGVAQGQTKTQAALAQIIPAVQSAVASLPPRGTLQQNLARANQFATAMSQFKRT